MATTKIIVRKKRVNAQGLTPIFIKYTHEQKSILFATGQKIEPKYFDQKGLAKKSLFGFTKFNDLLQLKKREIDDIRIDLQIAKENPTTENVKTKFDESHNQATGENKHSALQHWPTFVNYKKTHTKIVKDTIRQYNGQLNNLLVFEAKLNKQITFNSFDQTFYRLYLQYMYDEKNYCPNTVNDKIKKLKSFLNWAVDQKLTSNITFKKYKRPSNPTTIVTLTTQQLDYLLYFSPLTNKLSKVRDTLVFCCSTALRYSDYVKLTAANIKSDHIIINTKKTKQTIYIPLNKYSREILKRYPNGLPKISNQNYNDHLKELGEVVNFNEDIEVVTFPGNVKHVEYKKLHEILASHVGRRTYITESLNHGMIASDIMRVSGHQDLGSFQRYINTAEKRLHTESEKVWGK